MQKKSSLAILNDSKELLFKNDLSFLCELTKY